MKRVPKDYFTYTAVGDKLEEGKHLYEEVHAKYDTYKIYTTNQTVIDAKRKIPKYEELMNFFGMCAFGFFIFTVIFFGVVFNRENIFKNTETLVMFIFGCITAVGFVITLIIAIVYGHLYNKNYEINRSFKNFDEYLKQYDKILKLEEKKRQAILKKKASNLITVYDTLDNKEMQTSKKIEIIKKYMKEDE